jgi:predicted nuclease of restriction endonuclease-like (RecB) superfamily
MRQFYITYRQLPNLQQLAGEIPWMHNVMIMSKLYSNKIDFSIATGLQTRRYGKIALFFKKPLNFEYKNRKRAGVLS